MYVYYVYIIYVCITVTSEQRWRHNAQSKKLYNPCILGPGKKCFIRYGRGTSNCTAGHLIICCERIMKVLILIPREHLYSTHLSCHHWPVTIHQDL